MALKHTETEKPVHFTFGKSNYRWTLISMAIVVIGFMLMIGDTDIYDFRKIILAPIVVLAGFGVGFYAILKKPDHKA